MLNSVTKECILVQVGVLTVNRNASPKLPYMRETAGQGSLMECSCAQSMLIMQCIKLDTVCTPCM